ncbi:TonB-dependent receptor [Croceicoccus sp. Ery5]|uniref:TonB-dependent receptor n=1 Tax=Croceicoccus sp. Ery5 TaxID=1703340 RepID=UPI001E4B257E|nr:TonB-dependent receptor [Croceicoccus sp. Ery5]
MLRPRLRARTAFTATSLLALALSLGTPALAAETDEAGMTASQQTVEPVGGDDDIDLSDEIIVTAPQVNRGSVDIPQTPVAVLDEEEILSIGASSLVELLEELAPQTGSGRGRGSDGPPAILVNGQRISGFREMRNYPPEALARVEILPEEAAIRFGFRPDQRVINFILKEHYASKGIELEYGLPQDGGYHTSEVEVSMLSINGPNRLNIAVEAEDSSMLTEGERGVSSYDFAPQYGDANPADYQSLVADTRDLTLNTAWTRGFGENGADGSLTLNGTITRSDSLSLTGPDTVTLTDGSGAMAQRTLISEALGRGARVRDSRSAGFEVGTTLNKPVGDWDLTVTGRWTHDDTVSRSTSTTDMSALQAAVLAGQIGIDAPVDDLLAYVPGQSSNASFSNTEDATSLATMTGQPLWLPAGPLAVTVQAGFDWSNIDSRSTDNPGIATDLTRGDANGGFTLGIPLTSRKDNVLGAIGDITLDLSGGVNHLSDFGTLYNWSAGLNWSPFERLNLQVSHIYAEEAPSLSQLGAPELITTGATIYDIATGQTVLVDLITGGNPNLVAEKQRDWKIGANYELPFFQRSNLIVEYYDESSTDVSSSFPALTPTIEAAFPDRVVRDSDGNLVSIDQRPVTYAHQDGRRLRYGFDISDRISGSEDSEGGQSGGRSGRGGGGGPGFGPPGGRSGGQWGLALYHTIRFEESVQIASGTPVLDLLDGESLTSTPVARHEVEMTGRIFYNGFGARLSGNYLGGASIEDTAGTGSGLTFDPIATLDLRLFADLERQTGLVEAVPFFKGSRISFSIDNIFDAQQRVTDEDGTIPTSYLPDFTDPAGRFFEIDFRKRF